ncbi:GTPase Era [Rhodospirillaceae bacterium LM-1]|nr:GTPase Era [Rhodospirillaceae bacterium LM-1]
MTKAGFVAVLGAPNAGKSTLVNQLVGSKVSIVSSKVQTTRTRVLGIVMHGECQVVLMDTPGIFAPKRRLDRAMVAAAWTGAEDADVLLLLIDARKGFDAESQAIVSRLKEQKKRALLALNKVDQSDKGKLLKLAETLHGEGCFDEVFMISALTGDGCDVLIDKLASLMPEGPYLYPEDELSDMPQRLLAAEVVREQLYHKLYQELPYQATVETEAWEERRDGSAKIDVTIYVERDGQKSIVLGDKGAMVKAIGSAARQELEQLLERKVHLFLFVKVRENWQEDRERYSTWGLDFEA